MAKPAQKQDERERSLILGGDPDERYAEIPKEEEFGSKTFMESEELRKIGNELIKQRIEALKPLKIRYLWKVDGGTSRTAKTYSRTTNATGLLRFYAASDIIIWLAADHMREDRFSRWQVEASLFHELCRIAKDDNEKTVIVDCDFEGFYEELHWYGAWRDDLRRVKETMEQLALL